MSSKRAKAKTTKKRPQRATSNVFAMFDQSQIQEFKEAFNMIDQNRDGFIDKEDLHDMLASLGKNPTDEYLEGMMSEAPGPINFTMFLTMFGEKLNGTDPEDVIRNAFACFDEEASVQTGTPERGLSMRTIFGSCSPPWVTASQMRKWTRCTVRHPLTRKATSTTWSSPASSNTVPRTKTTRPPKAPMSSPCPSHLLHTHTVCTCSCPGDLLRGASL
uniref:Myosin light chain 9 n=1 Tax=Myotis myotis TaxID=51298 RepID=A0A7J7VZS7_MYOMY|nr:myosin light chain 9 [Myotis myotis]